MSTQASAAVFRRSAGVLWTRTLGGAVLLPPNGPPFELNESGVAVWDALSRAVDLDALVEDVAGRFGVPVADVAADIEAAVETLVMHGMVERS